MPPFSRVVLPGHPHHIIQRGNRRQNVFFSSDDKRAYLDYLKKYALPAGLEIWAWCLMDNHVHLVVVPESQECLAKGLGEAHRQYTRMIHFRYDWRGYLWQGRFLSYPLDEYHLYAVVRYIEQNPLRAGMVRKAEDYPWSSARSHVLHHEDPLCSPFFMLEEIRDWSKFLSTFPQEQELKKLRKHAKTGRVLGGADFIKHAERLTGRRLRKHKPGPKRIS